MTPESQIHIKKWRVLERAYMKESQDSSDAQPNFLLPAPKLANFLN